MTLADVFTAGAPELPEGMFYRVTRNALIGTVQVEIRERRKRFGSRPVRGAEARVHPADYPSADAAIRYACIVADERRIDSAREVTAYVSASRFVGDHDGRKN